MNEDSKLEIEQIFIEPSVQRQDIKLLTERN